MPTVTEMRHPRGFDFATERKIAILREVDKLEWSDIAAQVRDLGGRKPRPRHCANTYRGFRRKLGRRPSKYANCGRVAYKATKEVIRCLVNQLKAQRRTSPCTAETLQVGLLQEMQVKLSCSYIRKVLRSKGYQWLPRRQGRVYNSKDRKARMRFAQQVLHLSLAQLRAKLALAMDGTVLALPPTDPAERINFCRNSEEMMWRKPGETFRPELAGKDPYPAQLPLSRALPLWGGISTGGFAAIAFHKTKKLNQHQWAKLVDGGKLVAAIQKVQPAQADGPWHVLCDNEGFLSAGICSTAHRRAGVKLWRIPPRSPDLNPIERFWSWLKQKLRRMDLADALQGRPVLGKMAYSARVRKVLRSQKAQSVAKSHAGSLRKVCKVVLKKKGAATGF